MRTRRAFLIDSTVLAAATLAPISGLGRPIGLSRTVALSEIAYSDFQRCIGTLFLVRHDSENVAVLKLVQVTLQPAPAAYLHTADADHEKFSLVLLGNSGERLSQNTYEFAHDSLGRFDMFIAPVPATDPAAWWYEAIFNRARTRRSPKL